MTVPDEAVEAAARAEYEHEFLSLEGAWSDASDEVRALFRQSAKVALTAAAPFIAAQAWDEGLAKGGHLAAWAIGNRPGPERPDTTNPYRSGT